jgi:hypothetical protein
MDMPSVAQHQVELRLLRYVIAVTEELHFGWVAYRADNHSEALRVLIQLLRDQPT